MAIVLKIDNGDLRGRVDYTRYLAAPDQSPGVLRDRLNLPALLDFTLVPADEHFLPPRRSAFVRLEGLAESLPPGGPRAPGPLFTGFITNEPEMQYLGLRNGRPLYGYRYQATSEEYLLNVKRAGLLPPFLNQTAGAILRSLTEHLQPGRFDTASVAEGAFVPFYSVDPGQSWSEIARELAERSRFYYRVLDSKVYFQPIGDLPSGIAVDETDQRLRPEALEILPLGNAIHNDVTVFGAVEPQAYVREYFVGDGFTSRFPLTLAAYGTDSARLLADDFTSFSVDTTRWEETDPGNHISLFEGRLNLTGGTGSLGQTVLRAKQPLELGGELEFLHGEYEFVAPSAGILGGLYAGPALTQADCLVGFEVAPIGAATRIRAIVSGAVQAPEVVTQAGHHYILVTRLSAPQVFRTEQSFPSLGQAFGGNTVATTIRVVLEVRDLDLNNPANPATTVLLDTTLAGLPPFAFYAPANAKDLHAAVNFLQVTRPIQARLETQKPGEGVKVRTLGFGIAGQDATITADPHGNQWALEFYEDTVPARGERITLVYRAAGRARARVRQAASIAAEAALARDDGVRAAVLRDVNPLPRTSAECELAAQAWLADHSQPLYEGRYTTWSDLADFFPRAGRLLEVRVASRYPAFAALVHSVTSEFRELATERVLHAVEFGRPSQFEETLRLLETEKEALQVEEETALLPADVTELETRFIADVTGLSLSAVTPTHFVVDMGEDAPAGGTYQVRRSDQGWSRADAPGTEQNLLVASAAQAFILARNSRDHVFYVRPVTGTGVSSRHSHVLAVHYPLVPPAPAALTIQFGLDEQGKPIITTKVELPDTDLQDVDLVELRDTDNVTVLAQWEFGQLQFENGRYRARLVLDNSVALVREKTLYAYTRNVLGEYSAATSATASKPAPLKPFLTPGNSVGQILEILLDTVGDDVLDTQIQVAGPTAGFDSPAQDVVLPGQPEKFTFVAPQSGGWAFRARCRDALGWSPWSNEPQGQVPAQVLVYAVQFFQARELDPSIGAAINAQNLLPNAEFFLPGIAGQEGVAVARYFRLVNAAPDGSEVEHLPTSNEMRWKAGVNFSAADPGFRSCLTNLGKVFNPGEPVVLSAALRHTGPFGFAKPVRLALRSAVSPAYDLAREIAAATITGAYRWYSAAFTLPSTQAVPNDLAAEVAVVVPAGQSLASELHCDKLILNRGHRPAAFSLAPWDVVPLIWNQSVAAYELPLTAVAATGRATDPGNAGRLAGTGTEDLDPDFPDRYIRLAT